MNKKRIILFISILVFVSHLNILNAQVTANISIRAISSIIQGNQLSVTCDITNTSTLSHIYGVGAEIKDGTTIKADMGQKTTSSISPGNTSSVTFTYTIPVSWTAKSYTLHAVVWSGTPGSSVWLNESNRSFTVIAQNIVASISIRSISSVIQGNQLSVTCDITNTGNVSHSFGVGAEIKDGTTIKADLGQKTTSSIASSNTSSVTFTYTIPISWTAMNYTLHTVVWTGTPGSSDWLNENSRNFTVIAQNINASININSISSVIQGNLLSVTCDITNTGNVNHSFGVGTEIKDGTTIIADLGQKITSSFSPNVTRSVTFTFTIPVNWTAKSYTLHSLVWSGTPSTSDWLNEDNRSFTVITRIIAATISIETISPIIQGNLLVVNCYITNTGNVNHSFGVGAEIKEGTSIKTNLDPQTTIEISPNATGTVNFISVIPVSWTARNYTLHTVVWSGTPGTTEWFNECNKDFAVTLQPLSLTGRIIFHSYSKYMAIPEVADLDDGALFLYDINSPTPQNITSSLPLVNAMNPHISTDGSKIVFMAVPMSKVSDIEYNPSDPDDYPHRKRSNLDIFMIDLAKDTLWNLTENNSIADEDPKFNPVDGSTIIWKREGQIWRMRYDGQSKKQLTSSTGEKSGPNYSPDSTRIAYWLGSDTSSSIGLMNANGSLQGVQVNNSEIQDYFPIFRDNDNLLFSRWDNKTDTNDKVYNFEISTRLQTRLLFNEIGFEDADAAPINDNYLLFSSTRHLNNYDILIGRYDNNNVYQINAKTSHNDLGGCFSSYIYARSLEITSPSSGDELIAGSSAVIQVHAYSEGGNWLSADPSVTFSGPVKQVYTGFKDDGMHGDALANDGIYSKMITMPATTGNYTVVASSLSSEPNINHTIYSNLIKLKLKDISVGEEKISSDNFIISNYPNPFNKATTFELSIPDPCKVQLSIYNIMGEKLGTIIDKNLEPGFYQINWSVTAYMTSGLYYYRFQAGNKAIIKKMIFNKD